eukprot:364919-Chlamydomonas_euryale.AAC.7
MPWHGRWRQPAGGAFGAAHITRAAAAAGRRRAEGVEPDFPPIRAKVLGCTGLGRAQVKIILRLVQVAPTKMHL